MSTDGTNLPARPAPMTPEGSELRSYDYLPLHHKRLVRSHWWKRASHTARSINVDFWCEAYQQSPVASLPADDFELAALAGFGRTDQEGWLAIREEVMAPWVLCSDGRYYHPTLAEIATAVWASREETRRIEKERKARQRAKSHRPDEPVPPGQGDGGHRDTPPVPGGFDHRGEERRGEERNKNLCV